MEFGISFIPNDLSSYPKWLAAADSLGFSLIGVPDSQASQYRELNVCLTLAALNTSRARFGALVTCPVARHPAVTADAMASLMELSGGRVYLGIGIGESAAYNIGHKPSSLAELEQYALSVKALAAGKPIVYRNAPAVIPWAHFKLPLYLAGEGPKALALAGRIGDAAVIGLGVTSEAIQTAKARVLVGVQAAGRDPSAVAMWWVVRCGVDPDRRRARDYLGSSIAAAAKHVFSGSLEGQSIPEALKGAIQLFRERYTYAEHSQVGGGANGRLVRELGLEDLFLERFAVAGSPDEVAQQLQRIQAFGADRLIIRPMNPDPLSFLRAWEREIVPKLSMSSTGTSM